MLSENVVELISAHNIKMVGRSFYHFEPAALEAIIQNQSCQISYTHVPHGRAGGDEENKKILFLEFERTSEKREDNYPSWAHQIRI